MNHQPTKPAKEGARMELQSLHVLEHSSQSKMQSMLSSSPQTTTKTITRRQHRSNCCGRGLVNFGVFLLVLIVHLLMVVADTRSGGGRRMAEKLP
jgi:hypothetical protein